MFASVSLCKLRFLSGRICAGIEIVVSTVSTESREADRDGSRTLVEERSEQEKLRYSLHV